MAPPDLTDQRRQAATGREAAAWRAGRGRGSARRDAGRRGAPPRRWRRRGRCWPRRSDRHGARGRSRPRWPGPGRRRRRCATGRPGRTGRRCAAPRPGGMPAPLSATVSCTTAPRWVTATQMRPPSVVNFTALSSRIHSSWQSMSSSPATARAGVPAKLISPGRVQRGRPAGRPTRRAAPRSSGSRRSCTPPSARARVSRFSMSRLIRTDSPAMSRKRPRPGRSSWARRVLTAGTRRCCGSSSAGCAARATRRR